jgi:hypothetical protein
VLDELSEGTTFEEKMELSEYVLMGFHKLEPVLCITHNHEIYERLQEKVLGATFRASFGSRSHLSPDSGCFEGEPCGQSGCSAWFQQGRRGKASCGTGP